VISGVERSSQDRGIGFAVNWDGAPTSTEVVHRLIAGSSSSDRQLVGSAGGAASAGIFSKGARGACGPHLHAEGGIISLVDGRLDRLDELRRTLGLDQASGVGKVVVAAYAKWGDDLLPRLRGDYALVIWDEGRRRVLAARDPFGVRLLHYVVSSDGISVATDADQFVVAGVVEAAPDPTMVVEFLTRRFRSLDRSFFRDVRRIPPGHAVVASRAATRTFDYRVLPAENLTFSSTEDCHRQFREHFSTAVRRRIASAGPVVTDLSGGCDSSSIVCVADRLWAEDPGLTPAIVAGSAVYPGLPCDETAYIDAVAKHVRIPVLKWDGTKASSVELREPILAAPGNRMVMAGGTEGFVEIAREKGAQVVVGGAGGDLLGQPFGTTLDEIAAHRWAVAARHAFPAGLPLRQVVGNAFRIVEAFFPKASGLRSLFPNRPATPGWLAHGARANVFERKAALDLQRPFASHSQRARWIQLNPANIALSLDIRQRHASRAGLEMRYPFLDWDLVSFVLAIPFQHWPPPGEFQRIHREALRPDLPEAIYRRFGKAEFTPAVVNRVDAQLSEIICIFSNGTWKSEAFVDRRQAQELLARFRQAPSSRTLMDAYSIWAIASLETWLRAVVGYGKLSPS